MNTQQQIIQNQDAQIEDIALMVKRIKNNTKLMHEELDVQKE